MNLDELKSAWNRENTEGVHIPKETELIRKAQHPLDRLKRNMKQEWYMQLMAIVLLGFVPKWHGIAPQLYPVYYTAYTMLVVISGYYLNGFRNFYQKVTHYTTGTRHSLNEIYHDFRLNVERYHSFGFLLLPFGLTWMGSYIWSRLAEKGKDFSSLSAHTSYLLIVAVLLVCLLFVVAVFAWTKYYYGGYLTRLKAILDELKSDEA